MTPPPAPRHTALEGYADPRRHLLLTIGSALLGGGLAAGDVEDELCGLGPTLRAPDVRVAAWPTGLFVSLGRDDPAVFEPVGPALRFEQTFDVMDVAHEVRTRRLTSRQALERIDRIRDEPAKWPAWVADLGAIPVGLGLCLLLQPGAANVVFALAGSLIVSGLMSLVRHRPSLRALLPVASAFLVSIVVLLGYQAGWLDGPLRTIVAVLAILLPGSALVTGLSEIASGSAAAGTARLVSATVHLALFIIGMAAAALVTRTPYDVLENVQSTHLGWWAPSLGVALATFGLIVNVYTPLEHTVSVVAVIAFTAAVQVTLNLAVGAAVGGLAGALAAALAATGVSWLPGGPAWRIPYVPAFLIVAPGSFGMLNAAQVEVGSTQGLLTAASAVFGIAIGTLIGTVICRAADRARRDLPLPDHPDLTTDWRG